MPWRGREASLGTSTPPPPRRPGRQPNPRRYPALLITVGIRALLRRSLSSPFTFVGCEGGYISQRGRGRTARGYIGDPSGSGGSSSPATLALADDRGSRAASSRTRGSLLPRTHAHARATHPRRATSWDGAWSAVRRSSETASASPAHARAREVPYSTPVDGDGDVGPRVGCSATASTTRPATTSAPWSIPRRTSSRVTCSCRSH